MTEQKRPVLTLKRKTEGETPTRSRKTIINVTTPPKWKVKKQTLAEKAARQPDGCPRLYMTCGLADFLYEDNQKFRAHVQTLGLPLTYEEWEGGHTWDFWDASVRRAMAFFMPPENKEDAR